MPGTKRRGVSLSPLAFLSVISATFQTSVGLLCSHILFGPGGVGSTLFTNIFQSQNNSPKGKEVSRWVRSVLSKF